MIRWKPPIDLASEIFPNGSYEATAFGPCCPQPSSDAYIPKQNEQCLYLNIYQPIVSSNHSLIPVLVWIYGGGHKTGCSSQSIPLIYNGTNLIAAAPVDQPVIIVTINYRLGVLANMYLNELVEEDPQWPTAGNYMYLDMLSALRWIKQNIRDYRGDPTNVSLFGQSAGGLSVVDLGAVRGSVDLYRTAISQSSLGPSGSHSTYYNTSNALNYSNLVVQRLNCKNNDKQQLLQCLRNSSIEDLFQAYGNHVTCPIIDNYFFPMYPLLAIRNRRYNNISLIMGHNEYELPLCYEIPDMDFGIGVALIAEFIERKWLPHILDHYHLNNCSVDRNANVSRCCNIVRTILMDKAFDCDNRRLFDAFYSTYGSQFEQNKLFSYRLNCYPKCPKIASEGICRHASEIPFVFGTVSDAASQELLNCTWDDRSRIFSNEIIAHWMNIANTGRPLSQ